MKRLRDLALQAASSLWFIPFGIAVLLAVAAVGLVALDVWWDRTAEDGADFTARLPLLFGAGVDGARSMLATSAGALVTAAGITLSGVLVAVSISAGQYTSRVLRSLTGNRLQQLALGLTLGAFVYAMVVLRTIGTGGGTGFVPEFAVLFGLVLSIAAVASLLVFVHGVVRAVQASELLASIADETLVSVRSLFAAAERGSEPSLHADEVPLPTTLPDVRWPITAERSGYLREVDDGALASVAADADAVVVVEKRVGDFVVEGEVLASITGAEQPEAPLAAGVVRCHRLGSFRTIAQDPGFGVRQLVDIALRALSPGVNDTTTAEMAVHRLTQVLAAAAEHPARTSAVRRDGAFRVHVPRHDFRSLSLLAYEQVLAAAEAAPRVLAACVEGWVLIAGRADAAPQGRAAADDLRSMARDCRAWIEEAAAREPELTDADRVRAAFRSLLDLGVAPAGRPTPR